MFSHSFMCLTIHQSIQPVIHPSVHSFIQFIKYLVSMLDTQWCPTLCDPIDCKSPGSSVHGLRQARILEWVPISFSRRSPPFRDLTWVSLIVGRFFTVCATREAQGQYTLICSCQYCHL